MMLFRRSGSVVDLKQFQGSSNKSLGKTNAKYKIPYKNFLTICFLYSPPYNPSPVFYLLDRERCVGIYYAHFPSAPLNCYSQSADSQNSRDLRQQVNVQSDFLGISSQGLQRGRTVPNEGAPPSHIRYKPKGILVVFMID